MGAVVATFILFSLLFVEYEVIKAETTAPWYETLPAVAMDYKVHIDPGKEDCYFQYVNPGATFYVSFQVLRGGDGMAGFAVRHPSGQIVHPYQWRPSSDYQDQSSTGGYYSVCIDNQFSRFAAKLVNLYLTVIRYDQWDKFTKEVEELNLSVENFTRNVVGTLLCPTKNLVKHTPKGENHYLGEANKTKRKYQESLRLVLKLLSKTKQVYGQKGCC
ncbi:transmembrane emp24 domain-containing protein 5 isoform X2 [Anabrus simplex]|uniref:transmembrane emp24 domain-containing protein 5 isoform X2 n=1 Tax=Anabrus simplex TaxID=316456 RepID=UPI0035A33FCF